MVISNISLQYRLGFVKNVGYFLHYVGEQFNIRILDIGLSLKYSK